MAEIVFMSSLWRMIKFRYCTLTRTGIVLIMVSHILLQPKMTVAKPLDVLIVTPGLTGASTTASITMTGPAFDVAFQNLRPIYPSIHFRHLYVYNYSIKDCGTFQNKVQDILSRWYYCGDFDRSLPIYIVTPGKMVLTK